MAKITGKEGLYFSGTLSFFNIKFLVSVDTVYMLLENIYLLRGTCSSGPALVFEGEEAMLAAISEDPLSFKASQLILFPSFFIYFDLIN